MGTGFTWDTQDRDADIAAAKGHFVHVNVNRETRRPVPIDQSARDVLSALVVEGAEN